MAGGAYPWLSPYSFGEFLHAIERIGSLTGSRRCLPKRTPKHHSRKDPATGGILPGEQHGRRDDQLEKAGAAGATMTWYYQETDERAYELQSLFIGP